MEGVYLKYTLFLASMATNYFNFEKQKRFSARLKCHFLYLSHFHDEHVNTTTIHRVGKVNENLMSDMLSQHQNWYIQRNLCLGHSKFPTAIEAVIGFFFF